MDKVSKLIDGGIDSKDRNMVKKGISRGEKLIADNKDVYNNNQISKLSYFIGIGYMNFFYLEYSKEKGPFQILDNENLQNAKNYYRIAIKNLDETNKVLKMKIWTSYANCLDTLGRGMDALFCYDEALKIDPIFSKALGNKAIAMRIFADASGNYRGAIYNKSYKILKSLYKNKDLNLIGGPDAKIKIKNEIKTIESIIDKETLLKDITHEDYDLSNLSSFERFYVELCTENDLFLNFHIHENICEASISDPIFIRLLLPLFDRTTFFELARTINQIKEDYAVARLLLVQSQYRTNDIDNISQRTLFVNTPEYCISNIYNGLLKSSFKEAYNILDKIARFINEYYGLGIPENENIYITTKKLWRDKISNNNWQIKNKIKDSKNPSLYALYDIALDLDPNSGYYTNLRKMRNKLMHEKLVIHDHRWDGEEDDYNIKFEKMLLRTTRLFKIVKSAIIYLINSVEIEERKKRGKSIILDPIKVDTNQSLNRF